MKHPGNRYGNTPPTKAQHRAALTAALTMRERPLTERDVESMARCHRMSVQDVRALADEIAADKAARAAA